MGDIIQFDFNKDSSAINLSVLKDSNRKLRAGLISPGENTPQGELAPEHTAEPIKSMDDIMLISRYLISNKRYRDNMLFIVGINFGLRVSDLRMLRFSNIINDNCTFKETFPVFEQKTRNTRKHKKNRYITINTAVMEAVTLYLENTVGVKLSDYMFRSNSNHGYNKNEPINRKSIDRILKSIGQELDLPMHISTHTLRKTFAYHQMVMSNNDPRKLLLLSKMLGHSSVAVTMDYIGLTQEEMQEAYKNLNLGSEAHNYLNSNIGENESLMLIS